MAKLHPQRLLIALSLCLFGCTEEARWSSSTIETYDDTYDACRIHYPQSNPGQGFSLDIIKANKTISTHLNLLQFKLPTTYHHAFPLTLSAKGKEYHDTVFVHRGGQRLTLTERAQDRLIELLLEGNTVTLSVQGISQTFHHEGFEEHYQKFSNKSEN